MASRSPALIFQTMGSPDDLPADPDIILNRIRFPGGEGAAPVNRQPAFEPSPFHPVFWLPGGHLQTLGGKYLRRPGPLPLRRERWDTPDGDFLDLDFLEGLEDSSPLVLVLHGLEGFSRRPYVLSAMEALARQGLASVGLNFRSCSGEPNRLPRLYHSGETEDAAFVLARLRARWPGRPLGALGFSLGGNVLLKLLGERTDGGAGVLEGAAAISVPYDLSAGTRCLERGVPGRFYTRYFLRSLKGKVRAKEALLRPLLDLDTVYRARTLRAFDDAATALLHGFRDAEEYYRESSSGQFLAGVAVPTLLLHALNDPFLPPAAVPTGPMDANPALTPLLTPTGGHVGFRSRASRNGGPFWAEAEVAAFLACHLRGRVP